ncbi:amino acid ABC transporter permease [Yoonia sediminilitoris]|uniref:Amino acid ABC transporter membrane protein 2 (PAAT family) n=1 Tax=Yoonia sediminilitoris TaxID=1286148 RepID=A0A2T6KB42_9RHOB|nr:amino acid ABC transporter permease [Yoonia sediminilitoris]PUB12047.1 amino acid ABC transporter membrane protein 2 (PAAT family) [Yoonia sediminilitoris]RCW92874.1 amino acid ABC transporter membrane protein 2 (PAAT family) [Yoonia sediminilitoris]
MFRFFQKFRWPDWVILGVLMAFFGYIWFTIEGTLNYSWRWHLIPNYILGWHTTREEYFANILLQGLAATIRISIYASVLALILGTILGIARCSSNLTIRMLARTYLEFLRNIPPVVVIFIFFFFLSQQLIDFLNLERWARGIARQDNNAVWEFFFGEMRRFPSLISGVIVLALFESAFVGEIIRAGIQSIPKGQREAARSIGMSHGQELRYIVLPQAMKKVVPPLANQFISLIKDSAILSLISVQELTYKTVELVASSRMIFEAWITTAAFYFVVCFGLSRIFARLEKRSDKQ